MERTIWIIAMDQTNLLVTAPNDPDPEWPDGYVAVLREAGAKEKNIPYCVGWVRCRPARSVPCRVALVRFGRGLLPRRKRWGVGLESQTSPRWATRLFNLQNAPRRKPSGAALRGGCKSIIR